MFLDHRLYFNEVFEKPVGNRKMRMIAGDFFDTSALISDAIRANAEHSISHFYAL